MMKGMLDRLLKSLGISGRDWAVLLLALLLAFSIWLIHNLSLKYNDYLTVSIQAHCNIDGRAGESTNRCEVVARCRATGYNVLRKEIIGRKHTRKVTFQPSVMKHKEGDTFYVTSSDLLEYGHLIYGSDVTVEYFVSDTLFFTFPSVVFKRVPVYPVYTVSYRQQYMNVGGIKMAPDTVTLYGEAQRLENIDMVMTQPIKRESLSEDVQGVISLEKIHDVRFSVDEVHYSIDVARYVEMKAKIPVSATDLPADKEIVILPSMVEISLKCVFPLEGDPMEDVELYVRYEDIMNSISGKCPIKVSGVPESVIGYDLTPFYVECIVSDK